MKNEQQLRAEPGNPWHFEHIVSGERHYATWEQIITQHQIVAKGKWIRTAERLLNRQGLTMRGSPRPTQGLRERLRGVRQNLSFALFGFLSFRIKRWLRS